MARPASQFPNGRAEFANRDFGHELRVICKKATFSATPNLQMRPLGLPFLVIRAKCR
jgi:hypothetical protein